MVQLIVSLGGDIELLRAKFCHRIRMAENCTGVGNGDRDIPW